jgi:hypothetical protein
MSDPRLHIDVWDLILSVLNQRDVWSVMCTCRMFRELGLKHYVEVYKNLFDELKSPIAFLRFLLLDPPKRCPLVKEFHTIWDPKIRGVLESILDFLALATNLRGITIRAAAMRCRPEIQDVLVNVCRGLRFVSFRADDWNEATLLKELFGIAQWPLVHAQIDVTLLFPGISIEMLMPFCHSLKKVELWSWILVRQQVACTFPAVRSLNLASCYELDRTYLAEIFPNVTNLCARSELDQYDDEVRVEDHERMRLHNLGLLTSWKFLERVSGDVETTYSLALTGHIPLLELEMHSLHDNDLDFLRTLLDDLRPRVLALTLAQGEIHTLVRFRQSFPDTIPYLEALSIALDDQIWSDKEMTLDWVVR